MIYLKRFNEGQFYTIENILYEFAKDNLAYVLDIEGMKMTLALHKRLSDSGRFNYYEFNLTNSYFFEWLDIKDYFIPFLQRLQRLDYVTICPLGSIGAAGKEIKVRIRRKFFWPLSKKNDEFGFSESEYYSLEDTINDNFYLDDISKITFYIKQTN
jgi:hypothetical protein